MRSNGLLVAGDESVAPCWMLFMPLGALFSREATL